MILYQPDALQWMKTVIIDSHDKYPDPEEERNLSQYCFFQTLNRLGSTVPKDRLKPNPSHRKRCWEMTGWVTPYGGITPGGIAGVLT